MYKPKKVYLSVSYKTSKTLISTIKKKLELLGIEVLMYNPNQKYTTDKILKSDVVIGLPPELYRGLNIGSGYNVSVGKGQYTESEVSMENDVPYYMLIHHSLKLSKFSSTYSNMPDNWKENYGNIVLKGNFELKEVLGLEEKSDDLLLIL